MCGIVGYTGPREAGPILIEGLKRLEYRGYDSAGIALVDDAGDLFVEKRAGKLANLQTAHRRPDPARRHRPRPHALGDPRPAERPQRPSPPGLHRRHHGHPQRDHRELPRAARRARGPRPHAHLRDRHGGDRPPRRGGLRGRPRRRGPGRAPPARGRLRHRRHAPRRGRPARRRPQGRAARRRPRRRRELPRQRRRGDPRPHRPGHLPRGGRRRRPAAVGRDHHRRRRRRRASARVTTIDWTPEAAEKGGYEHFMLKEIHEQPEALRQSHHRPGRPRRPDPARGARPGSRSCCGPSPGSSSSPAAARYYASLVGAAAIQDWTGLPARATVGSEFRYGPPPLDEQTLVIAVTQSGETADTIAPTRLARERGCPIIAVTNTVGSAITREADAVLFLQAGPEIAVAASKTFVTQVTTLVILAAAIAKLRGSAGRRRRARARGGPAGAAGGGRPGARERRRRDARPRPPLRQLARLHVRRSRLDLPGRRSRARSSSRKSATSTPRATRPASSSTARSRCSTPSARWSPSRRARRSTTSSSAT